MKIKNKRSGRIFDISKQEWSNIVEGMLAYKYDIIDNDSPLEIKSLRQKKEEKIELKSKKK